MRYVQKGKRYRRDIKRLSRGTYSGIIEQTLPEVINMLANDEALDRSYRDHQLSGNLAEFRECHLAFDLVLVYARIGDDILFLDRLGSHSDIFGM